MKKFFKNIKLVFLNVEVLLLLSSETLKLLLGVCRYFLLWRPCFLTLLSKFKHIFLFLFISFNLLIISSFL